MTERDIIRGCKNQSRTAQKALHDRFSPVMFGVCKRYCKNREDAEDVLINGLFKAIDNIDQFRGNGSFEGWIRRIVVNEALMFLRKRQKITVEIEEYHMEPPTSGNIEDELAAQDILDLLEELPIGYRTVFNMYVLDGMKHREIAEALEISINTSKSQLILAKKRMQALLAKRSYPGLEGRTKSRR
ncbi:MAG: sigma-70 family RNA polymerase sigma factor [Bacteroidota bacterium]